MNNYTLFALWILSLAFFSRWGYNLGYMKGFNFGSDMVLDMIKEKFTIKKGK